ncbi:MAG: mandelate racemase/muconate lactonizing enzyme family protein [Candidatus Atribacteria bacterium]|nr:mandelate racemase/muconate lactonizing enzyme family protein [Candidatus Atribacteria bacterium]
MKITHIEAYDLNIPCDIKYSAAWAPGVSEEFRKFTLVIVRTDEGLSGYGGGNGHFAARIVKIVKPFLLGENPFFVEKYIRILRDIGGVWAIEIALWDIIGKAANLPLYMLWGASRTKIPAYASTCVSGLPGNFDERIQQVKRYYNEGFQAIKIRLHFDTIEEDLQYVDTVIEAVGGKVDIMVDANQATLMIPSAVKSPRWDYRRALRTAKELEKRGVLWLEEPLGRWDFDELARLRENTEIYIAGGEMNNALHDFRLMVEKKSYDIIQPDVVNQSLTEVMKIKGLCETFNIHFVPHHGVSAIGLAATIHILCTYDHWTFMEYIYDPPYRTIENYQCLGGIVRTPILVDGTGSISPPLGPGLGIVIDEGKIKEYKVD